MARPTTRPVGTPTRGTTNPNRLRRIDRWLAGAPEIDRVLRTSAAPLVVDLGYGASPVTAVELSRRLRRVHPRVRVLGLEIDQERVDAAVPAADPPWLEFRRGGFELAGARPDIVRAFNVLRQYDESAVPEAWRTMLDRLAPRGILVDGTCDEIGRLCTWIAVDASGPRTLTLSCKLSTLDRPSTVAERLPKALIHRNVPGERVHDFLSTVDLCWAMSAPHASYGLRSRWVATIGLLAASGWPVRSRPDRIRLGEVTVDYAAVAPR